MGQPVQHSHKATKLYDHLRELAIRLLVSTIVLVLAGIVVYFFYEPILTLLRTPLGAPLYYNDPAGSFSFVIKICFMGALIVTIPVIVYNLIMFVRPAFGQNISLKQVYITSIFSAFLAIAGAVFAFLFILPGTLHFLSSFQVDGLKALISADSYLKFVTDMIIMFVLVFQIPLLVAFIDKIKPLRPKKLLHLEKWVILVSLIIALLAPFTYDLVTSLLIALPIVALYNLSILMVVIQHYRIAHKQAQTTAQAMTHKSPVLTTDLALTDQIVASWADEIINLEKPASTPLPILKPTPMKTPRMVCMDIKPANIKPGLVKPAAWVVEKRLRKTAVSLGSNVNVFSDIRHMPRINRASA